MGEDDAALRERITRAEDEVSQLRSKLAEVQTEMRKNGEFADKQDHENRLQALERDFANHRNITGAVKWLAMSVGGSGILVAMTALTEASFL